MATTMFLCTLHLVPSLKKISLPRYFGFRPAIHLTTTTPFTTRRISWCSLGRKPGISPGRLLVLAATEGSAKSSQSDEKIPSWAKPDTDEPPPWARNEGNASTAQPEIQIPFYVYLLASAVIAIAAIGSAFEYVNQKPVFGVLNSDSVFYAPLLGFFAFTGIPTSAFLWFKSVQVANKEAEEQDRRDGYL